MGSNQNKLLGFTRGMVPVMDKSCMFSWRRTLPELKEPEGACVCVCAWRGVCFSRWISLLCSCACQLMLGSCSTFVRNVAHLWLRVEER